MAGLVPAIHACSMHGSVDARHKAGMTTWTSGRNECPTTSPKKPRTSSCSATIRPPPGAAARSSRSTRASPMSARSAARASTGRRASPSTTCATRASRSKVAEVKSPPGVHSHKLRVVDGDILYVNSERLGGEAGPQRPHRPVHLRHLQGRRAEADRLLRHARQRPAPLRRRQQAQARVPAERRAGLEQARDLDARHQGPDSSPRSSASGACPG